MERVLTYNLGENLIDKLADFIYGNFTNEKCDFSRVACIFGGKRPSLFLKHTLAKKIKKPFYPPKSFTIDEFVQYVIAKDSVLKKISSLDAAYLIYRLAKQENASIVRGRHNFSEFLPWAAEVHSFIEQLDLENIDDSRLKSIEKSANIGYDIPENINVLLERLTAIRRAYHKHLNKENLYSRGRMYLEASRVIKRRNFDEFDAVIFCNFFYLHKTELELMKEIYRKEKAIFIFQGGAKEWSVLAKNAKELNILIAPKEPTLTQPKLNLYQAFDMHSQACAAREILSKIKNKENTVIVLPRPEILTVLLSEVSSVLNDYNVSMGYPLKRSSLYALFDALFKTQSSRKGEKYYAKDYLNLLRHPLVKNLKIAADSQITRVLVHKLEELLQGQEQSSIGGSIFLSLSEIENEEKLYSLVKETLGNMGIALEVSECKTIISTLHSLFFKTWEETDTLAKFAKNLEKLIDVLLEKSLPIKFPFNLKVIEKIQEIKTDLESLSFRQECFEYSEIWEIFQQKLEKEAISFIGSPLKGTQVLGLFETRSLSFENVIVMDVNESILPRLKVNEPLIPREVMLGLGLNRLEKEEEIQRYQFNSLVASAKDFHLIYEKNDTKEKSRFIEEFLWALQKEKKSLEVVAIPRVSFCINVMPKIQAIAKTASIVEFLKNERYSASRINNYLNCPLQFYYRYVLGLREKEDLLEDPEAHHIGNFMHELLRDCFTKFKDKKPVLDEKFEEYFFSNLEGKFKNDLARRMKADSFLLKKIIKNRLERFLKSERERDVAKIICLEQKMKDALTIAGGQIEFVYTADRIDEMPGGSIIIIDYKTGGADVSPKRFSSLRDMDIDMDSIRENIKSFQLPLYYHFVAKQFPDKNINAELYNLRTLERKVFISGPDEAHKERIMEICLKALSAVFYEIFDINTPFTPRQEEWRCKTCGFSALCS